MTRFQTSGDGWCHDVIVGDLADAAPALERLCSDRIVPLVTDGHVLELHGSAIETMLAFTPVIIAQGEEAKSWATLQLLVERFAELGVTRDTPVIAFGGGSIGDVAGLAAALFKRGCPIIHLPTTLLAQVDSALGGKTAIDACGQKNLVGSFHTPALVVCDPSFLDTLGPQQLRAGYAETVKYGLIDDLQFFDWCERNGGALLAGNVEARHYAIEHCLRAKARLIGDDLRDTAGRRALLNFGHSFAHAIEALTGLAPVLHGQAVSVGMSLAFDFSHALGLCPAADAQRIRSHLDAAGLPTRLAQVGLGGRAPDLLALLRRDKKARSNALVLILTRGIGKAFVATDVPQDRLAEFLAAAA